MTTDGCFQGNHFSTAVEIVSRGSSLDDWGLGPISGATLLLVTAPQTGHLVQPVSWLRNLITGICTVSDRRKRAAFTAFLAR
jgi:hypothetical protein